MKKIGLLLIIFVACSIADAQQFGGNPSSLKWRQINTEAARVIFPHGLDSTAGDIAAVIERLNKNTSFAIGLDRRKINIVLQNQTTFSNGYVALGPYRSEFYLTPSQNSFQLGSLPWQRQLAIHEYRHVQQYNNFNTGLSKVFRVLFGEEGQAVANSLTVPNWFFEGDAVFNETRVSEQGRGRLPYFYNGYRSLWAAGKNYSWMKLRNGSLRDYTPDHYQLGYLLVAYGYTQYGEDFWEKVTQDAAAFKGLFYPFQKAVKKYSGLDYAAFRNNALAYFRKQFPATDKPAVERMVTDEEYPAYINDSTVVFVKTGYNKVPAFTIRSGTVEKKLRVKDISLDAHFSYKAGKIVYAGYRPDIRWGWRDYSVLNVLDITTGKQQTVTSRSKYFAPDINEAGDRIVAVQVSPDGKSRLHIIDINGKLLKALSNKDDLFYTYPKFYAGKIVSAVRNKEGQMSLALIDSRTDATDYLLPFSYNVIGFPVIQKDTVYFTASSGKNDRVFALSIKDKTLLRLNTGINTAGNYQPAVSNGTLAFSEFTVSGFRLRQIPEKWVNADAAALASTNSFSVPALEQKSTDILKEVENIKYTSTSYPKSFRLFNFHSLEPFITDPDYRLSLVGENVLNTLQSELFFNYNRNEGYKQFGYNGIYGAWFPRFSLGASYSIDRKGLTSNNQSIYWNEANIRAGFDVPLNLSRGRNSTRLTMGSDYVFNNLSYTGAFKNLGSFSFGYINSSLSFTSQVQKAVQHIYPRLAQTLLVNYRRAVYNISADQLLLSGSLYLPGVSMNHNLVVQVAYQRRDTLGEYSFSNSFPFARGYNSANIHKMWKAAANYHFPLLYPDAGIGNIVYLLRLRANLFYDYTHVMDYNFSLSSRPKVKAEFRSVGTEIFFDTKWWNEFPVSFGVRYSYLLDRDLFGSAGANRFEFILPVNLFQR
ncbi:MAG TPA: hypothetical protein VJ647_02510 [Chitinophagaceae bacterium]|nr:hypothetical protein [Chitinophagaceae bacterium]